MNAEQASEPAIIKRLVCLANSRKPPQGRCVAGRELIGQSFGGWVRPVSARQTKEVSERERKYQDGREPQLLDIIDVPLVNPSPTSHQQENWLLDPGWFWIKAGNFPYGSLTWAAEPPQPLWINGHHTYNGLNDCVPIEQIGNINSSLKLIAVDDLQIHVYVSWDRRRVQAKFSFDDIYYHLWVTDPVIERKYYSYHDGLYNLGARYLTVSLGEPYMDKCYKLVAAVFGEPA